MLVTQAMTVGLGHGHGLGETLRDMREGRPAIRDMVALVPLHLHLLPPRREEVSQSPMASRLAAIRDGM